MAGTITVDTIQSDSSYNSVLNIPSKVNFTGGMQIGGQDTTFGGMRNRIINGDMRIDQRNAGAAITPSAENQMSVDRFRTAQSVASKLTYQRVEDAPTGFKYSLKVTTATAYSPVNNDYFVLQQHIEKNNVLDFDFGLATASSFTVSFWVKGSVAGNYGIRIGNYESTSRCYTALYPVTSTWTKVTLVIPGDTGGSSIWNSISDNGLGLSIQFNLGEGASNLGTAGVWQSTVSSVLNYNGPTGSTNMVATQGATLNITGLQVEKGSSATPFEYRHYQQELALCQRYYQKLSGQYSKVGIAYGSSSTRAVSHFFLRTTMRNDPSVKISSTTDFRVNDAGANRTSTNLQVNTYGTRNDLVGLWTDVASGLTTGATYEVDIGTTTGWFAFDSEF